MSTSAGETEGNAGDKGLTFELQAVRETCPQKTKEGDKRKPLLGMAWDRSSRLGQGERDPALGML